MLRASGDRESFARRLRSVVAAGLALALAGACAVPRPYGEGVGLHALLSGGYRAVRHDDSEGHAAYALDLVTRESESGWGYEIGASYGAEDLGGARDHQAEFDEYSFGLRRSWQPAGRSARPYVAFGGALTTIEHRLHDPRDEFEDEGGAVYVRSGVLWDLGRYAFDRGTEVLVGFDVRGQAGDDADYVQLLLVLGFGR